MKTWDQFYDWVMPEVPGCPLLQANLAIKMAAIEFFERSMAYRANLTPIAIVAGTNTYALASALPTNMVISKYLDVMIDSDSLEPKSYEDFKAQSSTWQTDTGVAKWFTELLPNTLTLFPIPTGGTSLKIFAALKPANAATGIDDALFEEYGPDIAVGAKATLKLMPKKPYSNPQEGVMNKQEFDFACGNANITAWKGRNDRPARTRIAYR